MAMLTVHNLSVSFSSYSFGLKRRTIEAVHNLNIKLDAGKILAVVGQSGGGKSLLAHALLGILPSNSELSGDFFFKGKVLTKNRMAAIRGKEIVLIPQSVTYLNPLLRVGSQIARAAQLSGHDLSSARQAMHSALDRYRLKQEIARCYPFQLSGGMARRVLVATATIGKADLLLADEPTNGLDKKAAAEAMNHLRELADTGKAILLISHDIEAALNVADEVAVIRNGSTVEVASATAFHTPGGLQHPYTRSLWQALPINAFMEATSSHQIEGNNA